MRYTAHRLIPICALCCCSLLLAVGMAAPAGAGRTTASAGSALHGSLAPPNPAFLQSLVSPPIAAPAAAAVGQALGGRPGPRDYSYTSGMQVPGARNRVLPATYDLRTLGRVTSVKDQGPDGTCWSFAACGSLESDLLPGETQDFSEDNMVLTSGFNPPGTLYDAGGQIWMSTAYLVRWGGPVYETDDLYGDNVTPPGLTPRKHVQEVNWIPPRGSALDNDNIKTAVQQFGGADVSMGWYGDSSGSSYYDAATASYYYDVDNATNHEVLIVGWDDNYPAANFATTPAGNGAFIVKNSWGTGWGDSGYFHVSYYDSAFGRSSNPMAVFNKAEATSNYTGIYQYDPLGDCTDYGYGSSTGWLANAFTAQATSSLSAVGFYTETPGTTYEVYTGSSLATKTLRTSGTQAYMGYHTVTLPSAVGITNGQPFVVAVKVTSPGTTYPITIEYPFANYSSGATAAAGQSYVSADGSSWTDITTEYSNTNVCLKAYAKSSVVPAPTLTGFTPTSGPVGSTVTITGTAFSGASKVTFNGTSAVFSENSATKITATVPSGASSGTIAVTTPGGSGTSATSFTVVVSPKVTLKLSGLRSGAMKLGKRVTARGRVTPTSLAGSKVKLSVQKKKGARWVTLKTVRRTISAMGAYSWKYKPAKKGAYRMRATIARTSTNTAAKTPWRKFKVK